MKGHELGIRITIDGACHTGKTVFAEAFIELLLQCGASAEKINELNDNVEETRLRGPLAIARLKEALTTNDRIREMPIVFVERIVPRVNVNAATIGAGDKQWHAMPDLTTQDDPMTPAFLLPQSQVEFEMTNRVPTKHAAAALQNALMMDDLHKVVRHMPKSVDTAMLDMVMIHPEEYNMLVRLNELVKARLGMDVLFTKPTPEVEATQRFAMGLDHKQDDNRVRESLAVMLGFADRMADIKNMDKMLHESLPEVFGPDGKIDVYGMAVRSAQGIKFSPGIIPIDRKLRREAFAQATQITIPKSTLQPPTAFWQDSPIAEVLSSENPEHALALVMSQRGHGQFWVDHKASVYRIDRTLRGDWFDNVRERLEPENVYQCHAEVCVGRRDGESVSDHDYAMIVKAFFDYDPTVFVSRKMKNSSISGAHVSPTETLFKVPRGTRSPIYHLDDAPFQPSPATETIKTFSQVDSHSEFSESEEPTPGKFVFIKRTNHPLDPVLAAHDRELMYRQQLHPVFHETREQMLERAKPFVKAAHLGGHLALDYSDVPEDLVFDSACGLRWKTAEELDAEGKQTADPLTFKHYGLRVVPKNHQSDPRTMTQLHQPGLTDRVTEACRSAAAGLNTIFESTPNGAVPPIQLNEEETQRFEDKLAEPGEPNDALKGAMANFRANNLTKVKGD